jgi:transposase
VDETTLTLHPPLRACWMRRGQQKLVPAPGTPESHHLFAAYDWETDKLIWTTSARKNSEAFVTFLEELLVQQQPSGRCVLVLDNASYHTSATSRAALSLFEHRVLIIWLPPYCALELNPIERYWRHLKDQVCVNKLHPSLDELIASVEAELERQNNPNNPDRFKLLKVEV